MSTSSGWRDTAASVLIALGFVVFDLAISWSNPALAFGLGGVVLALLGVYVWGMGPAKKQGEQ